MTNIDFNLLQRININILIIPSSYTYLCVHEKILLIHLTLNIFDSIILIFVFFYILKIIYNDRMFIIKNNLDFSRNNIVNDGGNFIYQLKILSYDLSLIYFLIFHSSSYFIIFFFSS